MTSYPAFCDHILHQNELVAAGICHGDTWNLIFINNMLGEILKLSPGRMDDEPFLPRLTRCGFDEVEESLSEPHGGELIAHHKEGGRTALAGADGPARLHPRRDLGHRLRRHHPARQQGDGTHRRAARRGSHRQARDRTHAQGALRNLRHPARAYRKTLGHHVRRLFQRQALPEHQHAHF